ncbi:MAG: FAD:protein FMN transferase [Calditrichaeota bacterium]|nr:FAD:protein FMN transferase [Calditrichota bacterium]
MKYYLVLLFIFLINPLTAQNPDSTAVDYEVKVSKFVMGTIVETTVRANDISYCKEALFHAYREMERIENLLSYMKENSEITKINNNAGIQPVHVSKETMDILHRAVGYAEKLHGFFDVTIGPVSTLWGFSSDAGGHVPAEKDIKKLLPLVNFKNLRLSDSDTTAYLQKPGMKLDLGGIAKGYAIDRGSAVLRQKGIKNFILNAGGDMYVSGTKAADTPWKVGVKDPRDNQKLVARFELKDYAVATSGDYERYIIVNGRRYHHILDPRNGYPGTLSESSTTFAATAEEADVLATYLFIIGAEKALQEKFDKPFMVINEKGENNYNESFKNLSGLTF